jgi:hypothetical protein
MKNGPLIKRGLTNMSPTNIGGMEAPIVRAGILQRSGLIEYQWGRVRIVDRENLEAAACDCYKITKELYSGLYRHASGPAVDGAANRLLRR